jgi:transcriptional regulator with XRE-family HTH domain
MATDERSTAACGRWQAQSRRRAKTEAAAARGRAGGGAVSETPLVPARRATRPLREELPDLLAERDLSLRALARSIGVSQSYLSRILGAPDSEAARPASAKIAYAIAEELGLPADYFAESREAVVREAIAADSKLRDRVYDQLRKARK